MNGQYLKRLSDDERARLAVEFLRRRGREVPAGRVAGIGALMRVLGERLRTLADLETQGAFALDETLRIEPEAWVDLAGRAEAGPRLAALADAIAELSEFTPAETERVTRALATELGAKPGDLMGGARVALTGRKVSPGIFDVMDVLGRERVVARLREAAKRWNEARSEAGRAAPQP
jgi:glutamyl-tRNA synthetase